MPKSKKAKKHQSPLVQSTFGSVRKELEKDKKKRSQKETEDDAEERRLTAFLFAGIGDAADNDDDEGGHQVVKNMLAKDSNEVGALFELDTTGDGDGSIQVFVREEKAIPEIVMTTKRRKKTTEIGQYGSTTTMWNWI
jgi:hypothetical protein